MVGSPQRSIRRQSAQVGDQREAVSLCDHKADQEEGARPVLAPEQAAGALVLPDDEPHRDGDGDQDIRDGEGEVGLGALVDPEERGQELEHREDPEPEDRDPHQVRVGVVEQQLGERLGERKGDRQADRRRPEERREGGLHDLVGVLPRLVVEAQQRLDDSEADHDAGRDHPRDQDLRGAVVGRGQIPRVERQQRDRDQLRDHARGRVRGTRGGQPAEVPGHQLRTIKATPDAKRRSRRRCWASHQLPPRPRARRQRRAGPR